MLPWWRGKQPRNNAGHDLDLNNLAWLIKTDPADGGFIGHALSPMPLLRAGKHYPEYLRELRKSRPTAGAFQQ
jgi:hypothetical protein